MNTPAASVLLDVWERGQGASSVARALLLLGIAEPAASTDDLAGLSIGARDARLLQLRTRLFGATLECVATCPACNQMIELSVSTKELLCTYTRDMSGSHAVDVDGVSVLYRLPNTTDLLAIADIEDPIAARALLLERCIERVTGPVGQLADSITDTVVAEMAKMDPLADMEFDLRCPDCVAQWLAPFDIVSFLWHELESWTRRLLHDVHTLALAYSWSEAETLALSPSRRRAYLDLVAASANG